MTLSPVRHHTLSLDGLEIFYREAGPADAPMVLLPHGYPCSSFEFRGYMAALGHRSRLVAPDFPGSGLSATPEDYPYTFDGHADFLDRFATAAGAERFVLYLHDFGSQTRLTQTPTGGTGGEDVAKENDSGPGVRLKKAGA